MTQQNAHTEFEELCAGYVLGALSEEERERFEALLDEASPEQQALYRDLQRVSDELARATEPEAPSDAVEERLMASIQATENARRAEPQERRPQGQELPQPQERPPASRASGSRLPRWTYQVVAVALLMATLGLTYLALDLQETVETKEARITALEDELAYQGELLAVLASRGVRLVSMAGLDPSPDGFGKVVWDVENQRAVLQMANLPAPPEDKDYQLWLIKDEQAPQSSGVFSFEQPSQDLFFKIEELDAEPSPDANTFAVTLEPKGGMPQPTGQMYLLGQV